MGTCLTQSIERKTHYITIYISEFNHRFSVIIPEVYIINSALNMADVQILLRFPCTVLGDLKQCIENLCDLNCFLMIIRNSFWVDLGTPE